ncbi:hypothetical protein AAFC00_001139 [Neodothiora populina]|uniref:WSC domain-containing protein n=1 Tax=Neodothiora populina TaxID=2781224 RepID=A0ABR3PNB1_9PEZI
MLSLIALPLLALSSLASAGKSSLHKRDLTPEIANSTAVVGAGSHGYTYAGCYNETVYVPNGSGARALANGAMESNATASTKSCLDFCAAGSFQYAGLEYGQECWCSPYLSTLSVQLDASECNLACVGNTSEICGGRLKFTLFNLTGSASGAAALRVGTTGAMGWAGAVGLPVVAAVLVVLL